MLSEDWRNAVWCPVCCMKGAWHRSTYKPTSQRATQPLRLPPGMLADIAICPLCEGRGKYVSELGKQL